MPHPLPADRRRALSARADLPPAVATLVETAVALLRRAPSARIAIVRAGELLDPEALRPEARERLAAEVEAARAATLEPLGARDVERALRDAWGRPAGKVLDELDPEPLAVRPGAQVHRAERDGDPVAVKVRRPGVERAVRNDLALLDVLAPPLRAAFPALDAGAILRDAREQALDELDLEHEASNQRRIARALRDVAGVRVARPDLELSTGGVLVTALLPGATLADGARPDDPERAAEALVAAFRAATLGAGMAPVDPRPTHVLVGPDGLGLLGVGVARPVERERAQLAVDAFAAVADDDAGAFARAVAAMGLLPADRAREAHALAREVLGDLLAGPVRLDAALLRGLAGRTARRTGDLFALASAASPSPADLALARSLGQLVAVLARLEATHDWAALIAGRDR